MRVTKAKAKRMAKRVELRARKKNARVAQERRGRRMRKAIDRDAVFQRDRGVCATCGCDTDRLAKWLANLPRQGWSRMYGAPVVIGRNDRYVTRLGGSVLGRHRERAMTLLGRLWGVRIDTGAHLWEADHILPIAEGGSDNLINLRTLCRRCHVGESKALRARLRRRPTKGVGRGFA